MIKCCSVRFRHDTLAVPVYRDVEVRWEKDWLRLKYTVKDARWARDGQEGEPQTFTLLESHPLELVLVVKEWYEDGNGNYINPPEDEDAD